MNIRGIELLLSLGLPGARKSIIFRALDEVDLDCLYDGAGRGGTILVFDYTEPINQNPLKEKNVRKYKIEKKDFSRVLAELTQQMLAKAVSKNDIVYLAHQTYIPDDIRYAGRVALCIDDAGFGEVQIDAVSGFRKANTDFDPSIVFVCPVLNGKPALSKAEYRKKESELPSRYMRRMISDALRIPGNPNIDFEVYEDDGSLFYHDMFLAKDQKF